MVHGALRCVPELLGGPKFARVNQAPVAGSRLRPVCLLKSGSQPWIHLGRAHRVANDRNELQIDPCATLSNAAQHSKLVGWRVIWVHTLAGDYRRRMIYR